MISAYDVLEFKFPKLWDETSLPISDSLWLIDRRPAAAGCFVIGILIFMTVIVGKNSGRVSGRKIWAGWGAFGVMALGSFTWSYGLTDEVFINLVHPLNLVLHGQFSFSPNAKLDGTVEPLFYAFHALGGTRHGIIAVNFLLSYALYIGCGLLALMIIGRVNPLNDRRKCITLMTFASFPPVVFSASTGFGNVWLTFVFLVGLDGVLASRTWALITACLLLSVSRPEGICFAAILCMLSILRRGPFLIASVASIAGTALYFTFYSFYFGHWIPTPLYFKRLPDACWTAGGILPTALKLFWRGVGLFFLYETDETYFVGHYLRQQHWPAIHRLFWPSLAGSTLILAGAYVAATAARPQHHLRSTRTLALIGFSLIISLASCVLYTAPPGSQGGTSRYYLTSQVLVFVFASAVCWMRIDRPHQRWLRTGIRALLALSLLTLPFTLKPRPIFNRNFDAHVGEFLRDLPTDLSVSTSELDTLGYFADRSIYDLWGYVNTEISKSNQFYSGSIFSSPGKKINPSAFGLARTSISFGYVSGATYFCADCTDQLGFPRWEGAFAWRDIFVDRPAIRGDDRSTFIFPTDRTVLVRAFSEPIYRGTSADVYAKYNLVFAHDGERMITFLSRKEDQEQINAWLHAKGGRLTSKVTMNDAPNDRAAEVVSSEPLCHEYLKFPSRHNRSF